MSVVNKAYFAENHTVSKLHSDGVAQSCVITNRQKFYAYSGDKEIGVQELNRGNGKRTQRLSERWTTPPVAFSRLQIFC